MTNRLSLALTAAEAWVDDAPCAGQWFLTDPLSNVHMVRHDAYVVACLPALDLCRACPFTRACIERVKPAASYFDGVCGGRVWRGGRVVYAIKEVMA